MTDHETPAPNPGSETLGAGSATPYVFVSYRRDDVPDATDRLAAALFKQFGKDHVFLDVDSIEMGSDFGQVVGDWIGRCDVLLAVIGRGWLRAADDQGRRRLDNPKDYVRLEIEAGLERDTRVVPVLIYGTSIPTPEELPDSLVRLLDRQAVELSRPHWDLDVQELVAGIERIAARKAQEAAAGGEAEEVIRRQQERVPVAHGIDQVGREKTVRHHTEGGWPDRSQDLVDRRRRRSKAILLAVAAAVAVGIAVAVILAAGSSSGGGSTWQARGDLPQPLDGSGVTAYRGEIWVVGGCSNPTGGCGKPQFWVNHVYHYNPRTDAWQQGPSIPEALNHPALVSDGTHLYVLGGFGATGRAVATVFRLDSPGGSWQTDSPLPDARGAGAAAWDGTRVVFAGGADASLHTSDDVWALQAGRWTTIGHLQQPRRHLAGASNQDGTVWFAGGSDDARVPSPLVDVVRGQSVVPGSSIPAVKGAAGVAVNGGFCSVAGATTAGLSGDIRCRPPKRIPSLDPPRNYPGAAILGNQMYVVGGYEQGAFGGVRTVEAIAIDATK